MVKAFKRALCGVLGHSVMVVLLPVGRRFRCKRCGAVAAYISGDITEGQADG